MSTLMELSREYLELLEIAQDPEVDEQILIDTIAGISGEIEVKAGGYVAVMNHLEGRAAMYEKEAERLTGAAKAYRKNRDRIKERLKYAMEQMHLEKIETDYNVIKIQKNGGVQPMEITGVVPQNYKKVVLENDNEKIRKDLQAGVELTFAHLKERGTHLVIK